MSHASLAARYRPQTFAEVTGQSMVKTVLSRAAAQDKVAPAYLFSGTRGVGKTTLARIFAKALNCVHAPGAEPCNSCDQCRRITQGNHVDVVEIDGASNTGVDDARRLKETIGYAPMEGRYKVFIIDEAHMLSRNAFNALLKTLEEPPPRAIFIMATTEPHKFPPTIISRCQHFVFQAQPEQELVEHLRRILDQEKVCYDEAALRLIARRAAGSVRDGMSLLGQTLALGGDELNEAVTREVLGVAGQEAYERLLHAVRASDCAAVALLTRELLERGIDIGFFLRELAMLWRNLFLIRQAGAAAAQAIDLPQAELERLHELASSLEPSFIHAAWQMVLESQRQVLTSLEPAGALELLLLNLALLPRLVSLEQLSAAGVTGFAGTAGAVGTATTGTAATVAVATSTNLASPPLEDLKARLSGEAAFEHRLNATAAHNAHATATQNVSETAARNVSDAQEQAEPPGAMCPEPRPLAPFQGTRSESGPRDEGNRSESRNKTSNNETSNKARIAPSALSPVAYAATATAGAAAVLPPFAQSPLAPASPAPWDRAETESARGDDFFAHDKPFDDGELFDESGPFDDGVPWASWTGDVHEGLSGPMPDFEALERAEQLAKPVDLSVSATPAEQAAPAGHSAIPARHSAGLVELGSTSAESVADPQAGRDHALSLSWDGFLAFCAEHKDLCGPLSPMQLRHAQGSFAAEGLTIRAMADMQQRQFSAPLFLEALHRLCAAYTGTDTAVVVLPPELPIQTENDLKISMSESAEAQALLTAFGAQILRCFRVPGARTADSSEKSTGEKS